MSYIIHIDADCFFAAIEMRDNPSLRHVPMAVGGSVGQRGVISTCNYPARHYGVHSAMATAQALKLCPSLHLLPHRMAEYKRVSEQLHEILADYSDIIEPVSVDEAYLDISFCKSQARAVEVAQAIRRRVARCLKITVSAGVAPNKFLAKVASDWRKPNGLTIIAPDQVDDFVAKLDIKRISGVGRVTAQRLQQVDLHTCKDLQALTQQELDNLFGSFGRKVYHLCRGHDNRQVSPVRRRKSLSVEHTFAQDLLDVDACLSELPGLLKRMNIRFARLDNSYRVCKSFVKVKFSDFTQTTLECSATEVELPIYQQLLTQALQRRQQGVRLLGVGVRFAEGDKPPVVNESMPSVHAESPPQLGWGF